MSRRKPLAALAAISVAAGAVVPAASASAATPAPTGATRSIVTHIPYTPPPFLCSALVYQLRGALATGHPILANLLAQTLMNIGCGGAAI
jgi:hypothetical protein